MIGSLDILSMHCRRCAYLINYQAVHSVRYSSTAVNRKRKLGHYEVLGLKKDASQEEIKDAFFQLSKQVHPDTNPDEPKNHENFIRINEAYSVLSKPSSRREYDFSLAASIRYHQMATRNMYGTHTSGASYYPGSGPNKGFYDGEQQERVFWDETIYEMRDKTKDKDRFYPKDSYYGVKGMKRRSNSYIVGLCFAIIGLGIVLNVLQFFWSKKVRMEVMDKKTAVYAENLRQARERARINGTEKQLEIFSQRVKGNHSPAE